MGSPRTLIVTKSSGESLSSRGSWIFFLAMALVGLGSLLHSGLQVGDVGSLLYWRAGLSLLEVSLALGFGGLIRSGKQLSSSHCLVVFGLLAFFEFLLIGRGHATTFPWFSLLLVFLPFAVDRSQIAFTAIVGLIVLAPGATISLVSLGQGRGVTGNELAQILGLSAWYSVSGILALSLNRYLIGLRSLLKKLDQDVTELGSYALLEKLGVGGMGEVWRAEHKLLKRPAAVKLVRKERLIGDEENPERERIALARFEREAQMTARLTSPHTVRLFDYGRNETDGLYYAMELLNGLDLEHLVSTYGALPQERVRHILLQLCDSLREAHAFGLIHRDIKPANVYVAIQGLKYDFVKLLDFGLAIEEQDFQSGDRLTVKGKITGSPTTMAPEQAFGESVDARADIYAVGCVAFFALTGRHVFRAATPREMLMKHVKSIPDLPSTMAEVSAEFEGLILKCLAKNRSDRPQSAAELYDALEALNLSRQWTQSIAAEWYAQNDIDLGEVGRDGKESQR